MQRRLESVSGNIGGKIKKHGLQQKREGVCFKEKVIACIELLRGLRMRTEKYPLNLAI